MATDGSVQLKLFTLISPQSLINLRSSDKRSSCGHRLQPVSSSFTSIVLFITLLSVCFVGPVLVTADTPKPVSLPLVTLTVSSGNKTSAFQCPEKFGYYDDVTDCAKYFVCVFGEALHETCTGGLHFSAELQTCDWPRNVKCGQPKGKVILSLTTNYNCNYYWDLLHDCYSQLLCLHSMHLAPLSVRSLFSLIGN